MEGVTQDCIADCVTAPLRPIVPLCATHWLELTSIAVWPEVASFLFGIHTWI